MNKKSLIFGVLVTFIWLLGIYLFSRGNGYTLPTSLNELGDFLAGIFAPIAFFWLILGYIQQGKQLDQNTRALGQQEKALQLQIDEMRASAEQQKVAIDIYAQELNTKFLSIKPVINCSSIKGELIKKNIADGKLENFIVLINLVNQGRAEAEKLEIKAGNRFLYFIDKLEKNETKEVELIFSYLEFDIVDNFLNAEFSVIYFNIFEQQFLQRFRINALVVDDFEEQVIWEVHVIPN